MKSENNRAVAPPAEFWDGETAICSYCGEQAVLAQHGDPFYPYRKDYGPRWACASCEDVHVGCHPGTTIPLGRMADQALRNAKKAAHNAFDPLWKGKIAIEGCRPHKARRLGYAWLAAELGIHADECHIGWFDEEQCQRVIAICEPYAERRRAEASDKMEAWS